MNYHINTQQGHFTISANYIWVHPELNSYDRNLLMFFLSVGSCWRSVREIAKATNMSVGMVTKTRDKLTRLDFIFVDESTAKPNSSGFTITPNIAKIERENIEFYGKQYAEIESNIQRSPHEQERSPHEQERSPHETNKDSFKNNNTNTHKDAARKIIRAWSELAYGSPQIPDMADAKFNQHYIQPAEAISARLNGDYERAITILKLERRKMIARNFIPSHLSFALTAVIAAADEQDNPIQELESAEFNPNLAGLKVVDGVF